MPFPAAQTPGQPRFRAARSIAALVLREMTTKYGRSPGGYLWVVVEPVAGIALLSMLFMLISRTPPLGTNFPIFYATGVLPFTMYVTLSNNIATAVTFSRPLLAYPAVSFMDAVLARFLLTTVTHLLVMALVLAGIIALYDLKLVLHWPSIFKSVLMVLGIAFAIGVMNCFLFLRFPVWQNFWNVLNRPMFLISGIIFIPERLPKEALPYLSWNPVMHAVGMMRRGFYPTYDALYIDVVFVATFCLVTGVIGLWFLVRYHKDLALL
ncbi:ABC transporter permease (plasmid) [Sulfitobacter sp. S223]|uniref:ABC transporter permease n=1 Tax=Sulfitobacter sp. S223 TaxID=2867023 RepID=UPI0021FDD16F|nr:ABC transporter permease [Sulfitobacter sp. S223]